MWSAPQRILVFDFFRQLHGPNLNGGKSTAPHTKTIKKYIKTATKRWTFRVSHESPRSVARWTRARRYGTVTRSGVGYGVRAGDRWWAGQEELNAVGQSVCAVESVVRFHVYVRAHASACLPSIGRSAVRLQYGFIYADCVPSLLWFFLFRFFVGQQQSTPPSQHPPPTGRNRTRAPLDRIHRRVSDRK